MKTLQEIDAMLKELEILEATYKARKEEANGWGEKVDIQRAAIIAELQSQGVTSFKGSTASVSLVNRFSVKFPTDPEAREALKNYMVERGCFEDMWSINYQKLNGWYNEETAKEIDVPGLNPTHDVTLSFRRSAKQ